MIYEVSQGIYDGKFFTLNNKHNRRRLKLIALVAIRDDQFYAKVVMFRGFRKLRYQQYIHKGGRCPDQSDDLNRDGVIDFSEVIASSGDILIPLDRFIQEQEKGSEWFPVTSSDGSFYYSRSASVSKMMSDLYQRDRFSRDGMSKLQRGEELDIWRRTLVIYGAPGNPLLPVACAVLQERAYSNSSEVSSSLPRLHSFSSP